MIAFKVSGNLHDADYKVFVPEVEALIDREEKVRLLMLFEDFYGWGLHAAWDDMAFGIKHNQDLECIAMMGDKAWGKMDGKVKQTVF